MKVNHVHVTSYGGLESWADVEKRPSEPLIEATMKLTLSYKEYRLMVGADDEGRAPGSPPSLPIIPDPLIIDPTDPEVQAILGTMCFICGPMAHIFQKAGYPIPTHAEEEQAHILLWMLALYQRHGLVWREKGDEELRRLNSIGRKQS